MVDLQSPLELELELTDQQFFELCHKHENLKFERTATGALVIMSPTGGITSIRNSEINFQLRAWNRDRKLGKVFDSSGGFKLPNGAERAPDASWVKLQRWKALTLEEQKSFVPLCPNFVVELRGPADALRKVREKMREYKENGAQLGWLIDPQRQVVEVYRPDREVEVLQSPKTLSGEAVLPGLVLDLREIFLEAI